MQTTLPHKANHDNVGPQKDSLLLRFFGGDSGKVAKFRNQMDRQEFSRLRQAIARGSDLDRPAERVTTPAPAAPVIDKAKLYLWLKSELGKVHQECLQMIRGEVAATKREILYQVADVIDEAVESKAEANTQ